MVAGQFISNLSTFTLSTHVPWQEEEIIKNSKIPPNLFGSSLRKYCKLVPLGYVASFKSKPAWPSSAAGHLGDSTLDLEVSDWCEGKDVLEELPNSGLCIRAYSFHKALLCCFF